jgi:arylsulfatase A-like enzyme
MAHFFQSKWIYEPIIISTVVACFTLFCFGPGSSSISSASAPNVVYIMVDDLGSEDLGCYGSKNIHTPNLDQLAKNGMCFTQAYSGNTVCAPARSSLMTGQHMGHTPVRGNTGGISLPENTFTLADLFQRRGYVTGGFGKWGIAEIGTPGVPEKQGFDHFFGYYHQIHAHEYYPEYLYHNSQKIWMPGVKNDSASYTAYRIFDETKKFIINNQDHPFFCYAPWTLPHGQYVIPSSDPAVEMYQNKPWQESYKNYAAMVTLVDRQVGELVQLLESLGLANNTLVLFSSDNGGGIEFADYRTNGDLRGFKRDMYEGGLRIPMITYWPGKIPADTEIDLPVYFPDFMPTFADILDATPFLPQDIDGKSFYPWLLDPQKEYADRHLYWEYPHYDWSSQTYPESHFKQALRFGGWKMVRTGKDKNWELYDLSTDPYEDNNVADTHPALIIEFQNWILNNREAPPPQIEPERIDGKPFR